MKIIEKINQWENTDGKSPFYSFEYFAPKTEMGVLNLYDRLDRMARLNPLWIDVTWRSGKSNGLRTLEICENCLKYHGLEPLMHLTCTNMHRSTIDEILEMCKQAGICNILALRGDPALEDSEWKSVDGGFQHAFDLVKYIREKHGDYFCIGVAGYPEGHLENADKLNDIHRLKEKVDAGADFVITQLFYDVSKFIDFVTKCRLEGIDTIIIPGILPIQSYSSFRNAIKYCEITIPKEIDNELEEVKDDDEKVKDFGVMHCIKMCRELILFGVCGLHFYTLNLEESVMRIIEGLNFVDFHQSSRELPWRPVYGKRAKEDVRPIFWSNRPKSYIQRTSDWDEFPNGRWGNIDSPAFGDFVLSASTNPDERSCENRRKIWGESLDSIDDVALVFCNYLKTGTNAKRLPWCADRPGVETIFIQKQLLKLNMYGLLTINSQPSVNGALSSDANVGWGPRNGFVFQKAYVEFFCSPIAFSRLLPELEKEPNFTYSATNYNGKLYSNCKYKVNAVTWGVFPGEQIKQPTVVDMESFMVWKDEAFELWTSEWASIYPEGSKSRQLLTQIRDTWFLVNIVDNNFVTGDLFGKLVALIKSNVI